MRADLSERGHVFSVEADAGIDGTQLAQRVRGRAIASPVRVATIGGRRGDLLAIIQTARPGLSPA